MNTPADRNERERALDIHQSFIVQAPAGSGKTELLTQRYLALLAKAQVPEEIIAITFTRKAAAEMRARILESLQSATSTTFSELIPTRQQLILTALTQDKAQKWDLLNNPSRLRILTIDAFCAALTRQMPLLSHFGTEPNITNDAKPLYQQAAKTILLGLETDAVWAEKLECLLLHLDNDQQKVESLLSNMLARRDQWLPYIIQGYAQQQQLRTILEQGLQQTVYETLDKLITDLPQFLIQELTELAHYASHELLQINSDSYITYCSQFDPNTLPKFSSEYLEQQKLIWLGIAEMLLTRKGEWRKKITKNEGFPPSTSYKKRMEELLIEFDSFHEWREHLQTVQILPPCSYNSKQWEIITALIELLPILVAELHLIFQTHESVDHMEVAQSALTALGEPQNPTDLALLLDYQIKHILVDEFQDTSTAQYRLLEQLTAGWQADDGRTLFLVGDPMQSIYRFRKAEVGLFLQACEYGIGNVALEPLTLKINFRSAPDIMNWVNQTFSALMPKEVNLGTGAVPFSPSFANKSQPGSVKLHAFAEENSYQEQHHIIKIIRDALMENPLTKIAILVRARSDLTEIIPILKSENIPYRAVEIENLAQQPLIQDLFALTKALFHPADRIAWLSVLRAPWCGLTLTELHQLAGNNHQITILECLQQLFATPEQFNLLSQQSQKNLTKTFAVLIQSLKQQGRMSISNWIYGTWLALGGPASMSDETELRNAHAYFKLLQNIQTQTQCIDIQQLENQLSSLYATPHITHEVAVEVMTIHKAKGLEFDVVILPRLERAMPADDSQLLLYMERPTQRGTTDLLLAPIKASADEFDPIYNYLRYEDKQRGDYETSRLLYVAATRAKYHLHLLATLKWDEHKNEYKDPIKNSLLAKLWPQHAELFLQNLQINAEPTPVKNSNDLNRSLLQRFNLEWQLPKTADDFLPTYSIELSQSRNRNNFYSWSNHMMRHIGTVTHKILQKISVIGLDQWSQQPHTKKRSYYQILFARCGVPASEMECCLSYTERALQQTLTDARGRWILNQKNQAQSELPLSAVIDNEIKHTIIDRTFIDEDNIRWVIDYKTVDYPEADEKFIEHETQIYRSQLEQYAKIIQLLDPERTIRLGLYFPLQKAWREWEYIPTGRI